MLLTVLLMTLAVASDTIAANRTLEVLSDSPPRTQLEEASTELGTATMDLAGRTVDAALLQTLADTPEDEPLIRAIREALGRPVDLDDFILFVDDVIRAERDQPRPLPYTLPSGRARSEGVLIHPREVFRGQTRDYPRKDAVAVDMPEPPELHEPAEDGDPPSPGWTARFTNPSTPNDIIAAIALERGDANFSSRIAALTWQLSYQGAEVWLTSGVRDRTRGYLMWGAFALSRSDSEADLASTRTLLDDRNTAWGLDAPIAWQHPDGWEATREAARTMAEAYDVVYATENGARNSNHYGGTAIDLVAIDLPRHLILIAPDGARGEFDLTQPSETRDLSLSPELIRWVEEHFGFRKLETDYPHWDDAYR